MNEKKTHVKGDIFKYIFLYTQWQIFIFYSIVSKKFI